MLWIENLHGHNCGSVLYLFFHVCVCVFSLLWIDGLFNITRNSFRSMQAKMFDRRTVSLPYPRRLSVVYGVCFKYWKYFQSEILPIACENILIKNYSSCGIKFRFFSVAYSYNSNFIWGSIICVCWSIGDAFFYFWNISCNHLL